MAGRRAQAAGDVPHAGGEVVVDLRVGELRERPAALDEAQVRRRAARGLEAVQQVEVLQAEARRAGPGAVEALVVVQGARELGGHVFIGYLDALLDERDIRRRDARPLGQIGARQAEL